MGHWIFCLGIVVLQILPVSEAKLHYAVIFPSELQSQRSENICLELKNTEGESDLKISLNLNNKNTTLIEKKFQQDIIFTCLSLQVPIPEEDVSVGTLTISINSTGELVTNSNKVLVKKLRSKTLVQTDKAVYKPGQTVNFRILSINEDFKPENILIPVIEVQDPEKNRIGQWLNVTLNQGIADLSLALSSEPTLGEYSIKLKGTSHTFSVEEYVLPKFEVDIHFPKYVLFNSDQFPVQVCGKYTYGKPVQGNFTASVCREYARYRRWRLNPQEPPSICANFSGKLDRSGCHTIVVQSRLFKFNETGMTEDLKGAASVMEDGTGVELSSTSQTSITNVINKISFLNAETNYKPGIPYSGSIKVEDAGGVPKPNTTVYLTHKYESDGQNLVTDENGQVAFTLNTTDWKDTMVLTAQTDLQKKPSVFGRYQPQYGKASQRVTAFYSRSKSYLKLNSLDHVLPCEGHEAINVEYIISRTELNEVQKLSLHYLLVSQVTIKDSGTVEIETDSTNEDLYGRVTLNLPLSAGTSKIFHVLVYIILPNGEMLADTAKFKILKCFRNKVSTEFSPDEVLPGSDVSLQVQAAPGSLCGLRVVDQSVVLMKPEKELTADKVFDVFPSVEFGRYDYRIQEDEERCEYGPFHPLSSFHPRQSIRRPSRRPWFQEEEDSVDVDSLFKAIRLKIATSAEIKKPVICPEPETEEKENWFRYLRGGKTRNGRRFKSTPLATPLSKVITVENDLSPEPKEPEKVRAYFPETWIWELVALGDSGRSEIHQKAPDTITDWNAGAICLGPNGFGLSPSSSLRVFQPFFVDLTLPYSVIRGESFTLKASVFNYLKQCIKVRTTLQTTEELEETPCADCEHSSCICADESKTFYWNLKASKLGDVNITVKTEALDTKEFCGNEIPVVPKQGRTDTIVKTVLVQPGGVLEEKSHSSLICIKEEDQSKVEEISLNIPDNILEDSARAHITVLGDLMGTAMQNLDRLLAMPYGCGEQNMVLFAPNIFILQYLEKTHQLNNEIQSKAKKFMESGYQRQLTYKRDDGSYSAFGKRDKEGNTWLTGFVVKSFSKARPYIFIDESHLNHSFSWLKKIQQDTGCFRSVGRLFNNAMKGGVEDEISLSAYITIAILEANVSRQDPLLSNALSCLMKASVNVSNVYTQALLAYTFSLSGETELRESFMEKLEEKAVRGDGQLHWKRDSAPPSEVSYWYRAPSAEVEMTSYVLLAFLSGATPDIGKASQIVNWLSKQQNAYGGYASTQDTVVALQAMAKYGEMTFSNKGDVNVAVSSKSGFLEQFHVDKNNRLLLQRATLSKVPEDYTVTGTGNGCVFVQAVLRYNVPPPKGPATFSLSVKSSSRRECLEHPVTKFEILINASYTGTREKSNMAVIEVKMLSGYIPVKFTIRKLEKDKLIQRSEIQTDLVTLYMDQIGHNPVNLSFTVEQDIEVKDLKPATAKVYDYYETDEQATVDYNHPCSYGKLLRQLKFYNSVFCLTHKYLDGPKHYINVTDYDEISQ
ncbi:alpha-2-macroglobulin-like [Anomaloglossus baeobatrachus]|uniref:alpha-2-macroglobulin-like n=1 Tax=Anomaloglossus baeobatrachus TaxID=238106 RepID=UPI003F4F5E65